MPRPLFAPFALLALAAPALAKDRLPESTTFVKEAPGGRFVLVVLGDPAADARAVVGPDEAAKLKQMRETYPRSGLYRANAAELVWPLDGYAPADSVFPASDGVYLARLEGEWWRTKEYPSPSRLPADIEEAQLQAPAVTFFQNGEVLKRYRVADLLLNPRAVKHSPQHVLWAAGAVLNEDTGRFLLHLQDSERVAFDYRTGEVAGRERVGLGNPLFRVIAAICGAMVLLILAGWAVFVMRNRKPSPP